MIEERDLDAAVAAGIIDAGTRERLVLFARDLRRGTAGADEEQFRLLTGFNDIFAAIAIGLLLVAVAAIAGLASQLAAMLITAVLSWALAEFFTRARRMALPSILLLLSFVGSVLAAALIGLSGTFTFAGGRIDTLVLVIACLAGVGAAAAHWWRFRVPITIAAGAAVASLAVVGTAGGTIGPAFGLVGVNMLPVMILLCGIAVFTLAMWYDNSDPARVTRRSDVAFWLHLLAAPMLVHALFTGTGLAETAGRPMAAVIIVIAFLLFVLAALAIDRRALIVSALGYAIYAVQSLLGPDGVLPVGSNIGLLVIGIVLVLLSAGWRPARLLLLARLPEDWRTRLPNPIV